jgi:hypothetical protein
MWLLVACYLVFYVLVFQHLSKLNRQAVCRAHNRVNDFLDKMIHLEDTPDDFRQAIYDLKRVLRQIFEKMRVQFTLKFVLHTFWITPMVVIFEIVSASYFDKEYSKTVEDATYAFAMKMVYERLQMSSEDFE